MASTAVLSYGHPPLPSAPPLDPYSFHPSFAPPPPVAPVLVQIVPNYYPLHDAVTRGEVGIVRQLITAGFDVHLLNGAQKTAVAYANNRAILQCLLEAGARIEPSRITVYTGDNKPFIEAIQRGDVMAVKTYIENGQGNVHAVLENGKTPLHVAAAQGDPLLVLLLVRAGANLDASNARGFSPLSFAIDANKTEAANVLIRERASVTIVSKQGWTPLHQASYHGCLDVVRNLIAAGAPLEASNDEGNTPLMLSLSHDKGPFPAITEALLQAGANIRCKNKKEDTVLHRAAANTSLEWLVKRCLDAGFKVDIANKIGKTPLHCAAEGGSFSNMRLLLKRGADPRAGVTGDGALLHYASMGGNKECIEYCVNELKQDVNLPVAKLHRLPIHFAACWGKVEGIETLLALGASVDSTDDTGRTPLHLAAEEVHPAAVDCLLRHGANANARDNSQVTPLLLVAVNQKKEKEKHIQAAQKLLQRGADVNARGTLTCQFTGYNTFRGSTQVTCAPLHIAARNSDGKMAALFIQSGANATAKDSTGFSPDMHAKDEVKNYLRTQYNEQRSRQCQCVIS
jgi:ankyrin repeat protein